MGSHLANGSAKRRVSLTDVCAGKGQNLYQIDDKWFRRGELYDASQQIAALKTVLGPEEWDRRKKRKFTEVGGKVDKGVVEEIQVEKVVSHPCSFSNCCSESARSHHFP
jgi:hypothetical protein